MATQAGTFGEQPPSAHTAAAQERSVIALTKELIRESEALARAEVALVKSEISEKIDEAQKGLSALAAGGATLTAGLFLLLLAAVFALDRVIELWLAALLVGLAAALLGVILVASGKHTMRAQNLKPERTLEEIHRGTALKKEQAE